MVKILPAGANVNLNLGEDPMDRLVKTVDLAMKVGGAFQKGQDRRRTNSSNEMSDLMTMLTNGSQYLSGDDYQKIGNQIKNATSTARGIGSPTLTTQADLLENVHESMSQSNTEYENSLLTFNNDFMNIDIFNQANYTDADGNPNMAFLDEINAKGIDFFNETQTQLSNYQRQLFSVGSNGELIPKRNNQASRKAQADYQKVQNMFYNLYDSRLKNKVSEEEYMYIANNGGLPNEVLDDYRDTVIKHVTNQINNVERGIASNDKVSNSLKIKKTDKLRMALQNTDDGVAAWMQGFLEIDKEITEDELDTALDLTPEDYEAGVLVGPDGQIEEIPDRIKRVYDELISQTESTEIDLRTRYFDLKERFDYWSPFAWDSTGTVSDSDGKVVKFETDSTEEILDEDGDGIPDYIQRPETEKTIDKEEDSEEESVKQPALNEKQLNSATPYYNNWKRKTEKEIKDIQEKINLRKKSLNRMTSFNKDAETKQKNKVLKEIESLENKLKEHQVLLTNADINTWVNTIADKTTVGRINKGLDAIIPLWNRY